MDAPPAPQLAPNPTIRALTWMWAMTGAAWVVAIALSYWLHLWSLPAVLAVAFAITSLAILILVAFSARTRDVWNTLKLDTDPVAYRLWTVLGAVVGLLFAAEGWTLTGIGFFPWATDWRQSVVLVMFLLPLVWAAVRLRDYRRLFASTP